MRKDEELTNPNSCLNRAYADEIVFVLLARDQAAPSVIRYWIYERLRLKLNTPFEPQILEAMDLAAKMERERDTSED